MAWARTGWASVGSRRSRLSSTSRPASMCWRSFRSATLLAPWDEARSSASRRARWRISSGMDARSSEGQRFAASRYLSGTPHGVDLRGPRRQWTLGPALANILTGEHLTTAGRTVHAPGLPLVEGDSEDGGLWLDAHVHPSPAHATVLAAEQDADVALEIRTCGHPDGLRITRDLADIAAVGLSLGIQRLEPGAGPVLSPVRAAEQPGAADGKDHPRTPAPDQHAVHVHGVIVQVLPMAHVLPVQAAVEAADDTADFDGAVDLVGIGGIGGQLQDTFGRVGAGGHRHLREADGHRELLPALATVFAPIDLTVLVPRVQHLGVARIDQQGPNGQAVVRDVELFPVLPVVRAAVGTVLRPDIHGLGLLGVGGNGTDGGRLG